MNNQFCDDAIEAIDALLNELEEMRRQGKSVAEVIDRTEFAREAICDVKYMLSFDQHYSHVVSA